MTMVFERLCNINITTLNENTMSKKNVCSRGSILFLTKDLSKAIMTRSRLGKKFLNKRTE